MNMCMCELEIIYGDLSPVISQSLISLSLPQDTCTHTHTHTHTHICIYIYIYIYIYIKQYHQQISQQLVTLIMTRWEHGFPWLSPAIRFHHLSLPYKAVIDKFCWLPNTCTSMWRDPSENVAYEFVLTFPVVSRTSCSSYLDGFRDGRLVAVQLHFLWDVASRICLI